MYVGCGGRLVCKREDDAGSVAESGTAVVGELSFVRDDHLAVCACPSPRSTYHRIPQRVLCSFSFLSLDIIACCDGHNFCSGSQRRPRYTPPPLPHTQTTSLTTTMSSNLPSTSSPPGLQPPISSSQIDKSTPKPAPPTTTASKPSGACLDSRSTITAGILSAHCDLRKSCGSVN